MKAYCLQKKREGRWGEHNIIISQNITSEDKERREALQQKQFERSKKMGRGYLKGRMGCVHKCPPC